MYENRKLSILPIHNIFSCPTEIIVLLKIVFIFLIFFNATDWAKFHKPSRLTSSLSFSSLEIKDLKLKEDSYL